MRGQLEELIELLWDNNSIVNKGEFALKTYVFKGGQTFVEYDGTAELYMSGIEFKDLDGYYPMEINLSIFDILNNGNYALAITNKNGNKFLINTYGKIETLEVINNWKNAIKYINIFNQNDFINI